MENVIEHFRAFSEDVYVSDPETYEMLFFNQAGMESYGYKSWEQIKGKKCYEVLQHKDSPCLFCTNGQLCHEKYLEWEYDNPITGKKYLRKDKLVDWEGRTVRMGIALDVTGYGERRAKRELVAMECIKQMYSSVKTDEAIQNALETLGTYLNGERTYIFQIYGKFMDNTYEWCAEGISQEKDSLQEVPLSVIERWVPYFFEKQCVIIRDIEEVKGTSIEEYETLRRQNIKSLIAVPLVQNGKLEGYFGVDNPGSDNLNEISNMMQMLAYFFQSLLERKGRETYLERIGFTDGMTGALNRNAFIRDTMPENNRELDSVGLFFIDINDLKKTNDSMGHEAGDKLICKVYQELREAARDYTVYRLGGDEFVILCRNISEAELHKLKQQIQERLDGKRGYSAAVGAVYKENSNGFDGLMKEADKDMYRQKKRYHGTE